MGFVTVSAIGTDTPVTGLDDDVRRTVALYVPWPRLDELIVTRREVGPVVPSSVALLIQPELLPE
jgi:hypothetical protein